jgi:serine/threonine protein phosphatase PrpC
LIYGKYIAKGVVVKVKIIGIALLTLVGINAAEKRQLSPSQDISAMVGVYTNQNKRPYQEDRFFYGNVDGGLFCAIYDGHTNDKTSEYLKNNLHLLFAKVQGSMQERFEAAFALADENVAGLKSGSTASVVYIKDTMIYFAHVGDSRAVLSNNGKIDFVTSDHKPNREDEKMRITDAGGRVGFFFGSWRVNASLAVSRSIGDYSLKPFVICIPEYTAQQLKSGRNVVIMGSDGFWDVVSNEDAVKRVHTELCGKKRSLDRVAQLLAEEALRNSMNKDNVTVMVIKLPSDEDSEKKEADEFCSIM